MEDRPSLTYGSYLAVEELLALQRPRSRPAHHDELLFIVIHQVYELWFKQMLHELDAALRDLDGDHTLRARKRLRRVTTIQGVLGSQVDVLETMTPQEFGAFRSELNPASGFQSAQFREIEALCGLGGVDPRHFAPTTGEHARIAARLAAPTLPQRLAALLARRGFAVAPHDAYVASLRRIYEDDERYEDLYLLLDDLIEFDERLLLWRDRHVRMVERMIGAKPGTGGSLGARYLRTTLDKRVFPELWEVRTVLGTEARG